MIISWVQGNADPYFSPTSSITQVGKHLLKFQCPTPARCLAHNGRSVNFLLDKWHDKRAKWEKTLAMAASLGNHLLLWLWICDTKNKCKSISVLRAWVLPTRWICFLFSLFASYPVNFDAAVTWGECKIGAFLSLVFEGRTEKACRAQKSDPKIKSLEQVWK